MSLARFEELKSVVSGHTTRWMGWLKDSKSDSAVASRNDLCAVEDAASGKGKATANFKGKLTGGNALLTL